VVRERHAAVYLMECDSVSKHRHRTTRRTRASWLPGLTASLLLTGCATTLATPAPSPAASSAAHGKLHGTADVAYAGSLQLVNDQFVAPAFTQATGDTYRGRGGGSFGVAHLIASKEITPNVFESIGTGPIRVIDPGYTHWAIGFASSPLVIAYSDTSPYAAQLRAIEAGKKPLKDLFILMEQPNFHLGRTNPQTDPQGQAFILMLRLAQQYLHLPGGTADKILKGINNPSQIFAEEDILSRLQAGQLDASSAFLPEAIERHLPYIALPAAIDFGDPADRERYATQHLTLTGGKTITGAPLEVYISALYGTPDAAAGQAFVHFVLSPAGQTIYRKEGFILTARVLYGDAKAVPADLRAQLQ